MEKTPYHNPTYPQLPSQMIGSGSDGVAPEQMPPGLPTYAQATNPKTEDGYQPPHTLNADYVNRTQPSAANPSTQYAGQGGVGGGGPQYSQQGNVPQGIQQPPVVFIQREGILPLGPEPVYITCPFCHIQKMTRIEFTPTMKTHLMAALMCLLGLWCCVCVPYCAESCMSANHYCGNCNRFLGSYGNSV